MGYWNKRVFTSILLGILFLILFAPTVNAQSCEQLKLSQKGGQEQSSWVNSYNEGVDAYCNNEPERAERIFKNIDVKEIISETDVKPLREKAREFLFAWYEPKLAEILYGKVLETDPYDLYALHNKGYALYLQDKYYLSIEYFDRALIENPEYSYSLWGNGLSLVKLGKSDDAFPQIYKSLEIEKNNDALTTLGYALSEQGKNHQAITYHEESIKLYFESGYAHQKFGYALNKIANYAEAKVAYENAIKYEAKTYNRPNDLAESYLGLGFALYNLGLEADKKDDNKSRELLQNAADNYKKVIKILEDATNTDASTTVNEILSEANVGIGLIHIQFASKEIENSISHYQEAIEYFDTALAINSRNSDAIIHKADTMYSLNQPEDQIMFMYNMVLESDPKNIEALISKANVLFDQNKKRQALKVYERAIEINPNNFEALFGTGTVLTELQDCNALDFYHRALETDPDNEEARSKLKEEESQCTDFLGNYVQVTSLIQVTAAAVAAMSGLVIYLKKVRNTSKSNQN